MDIVNKPHAQLLEENKETALEFITWACSENSSLEKSPEEILAELGELVDKSSFLVALSEQLNETLGSFMMRIMDHYKLVYVPGFDGDVVITVMETLAKWNVPHTLKGWLPVQCVGPSLVFAHYLPNAPRDHLPKLFSTFVLVDQANYAKIHDRYLYEDIDSIRINNDFNENFKIMEEPAVKKYSENELTLADLIDLCKKLEPAEGQAMVMLNEIPNRLAGIDLTTMPWSQMIDFVSDEYDCWLKAKTTEGSSKEGWADTFGVEEAYVGTLDPRKIANDGKDMAFVKENAAILEKYKAIPLVMDDVFAVVAAVTADQGETQTALSSLLIPRKIYYVMVTKNHMNDVNAQRRQAAAEMETLEVIERGSGEAIDIANENFGFDLDNKKFEADEDKVRNMTILILNRAITSGASDIHLEPYGSNLRVRFRIDGDLRHQWEFQIPMLPFIVRCIKNMANMDSTKDNIPLDGRIQVRIGGRRVDLRVATAPAEGLIGNYEKCVIRILDASATPVNLDNVVWHGHQRAIWRRVITQPYGIILVTGPTGSGKSTTLYSALNEVNRADLNIMTAEDPVERKIIGVNQTNIVKPNSFSLQLRACLRMDPDVILVGEIRDEETAELAIKASQTGHLLLSTLHCNTALSGITRLGQLGVKRFDMVNSLLMITAQRLIRRLCPGCKIKVKLDQAMREHFKQKNVKTVLVNEGFLFKGRGCPACDNTGFRGRINIMEVLECSEEFKTVLGDMDKNLDQIKDYAIEKLKFENMHYYALEAIARGDSYLIELIDVPDRYLG